MRYISSSTQEGPFSTQRKDLRIGRPTQTSSQISCHQPLPTTAYILTPVGRNVPTESQRGPTTRPLCVQPWSLVMGSSFVRRIADVGTLSKAATCFVSPIWESTLSCILWNTLVSMTTISAWNVSSMRITSSAPLSSAQRRRSKSGLRSWGRGSSII